jgi:hypothetical protein
MLHVHSTSLFWVLAISAALHICSEAFGSPCPQTAKCSPPATAAATHTDPVMQLDLTDEIVRGFQCGRILKVRRA